MKRLQQTQPGIATAGKKQQGMALITILVMLMAMTVIGVGALQLTNLQQMMAGNWQESHHSFQIAETGLVDGFKDKRWVTDKTVTVEGDNTANNEISHGKYSFNKQFAGSFKLPRGSGYSINFKRAQYTVESTGEYTAGSSSEEGSSSEVLSSTTLIEGVYQITPF